MRWLDAVTRRLSRLEKFAIWIRSRLVAPRWAVAPVVIGLLGLSAFAWQQLPTDRTPSYPIIGLVALLGVASLAVNSIEFRLTAVFANTTIPARVAAQTVLTGTIANILPLPGSQLVRAGVLKARGVPLRRSLSLSVVVGVVWILIAVSVCVPILVLEVPPLALLPLLMASLASALAMTVMAERSHHAVTNTMALVLTETSLVLFQILRLLLLGSALGIEVDSGGAAGLTLAATLAAGVALLPSGLGMREGLSMVIGPLTGVGRAESLLLSVFDQAIAYATFAVVAGALMLLRRSRHTSPHPSTKSTQAPGDTGSAT